MKKDYKDLNILIVGAGTMGRGIAEIFASKGIHTYLYDTFPDQLPKAKALIASDMAYLKEEGVVTDQDIQNTQVYISYESDLSKCAPYADVAIECVFENAEAKKNVFMELDGLCPSECLFCSNTSGSNIFELAKVSNPGRLMITHYFNPAYVMPLVEVVVEEQTSLEAQEDICDLLTYVGKKPSVIKQYIPGFIVNRIATAIVREAGYMIEQGWTTGKDIDSAIRYTSSIRYAFEGPLALYDIVGWDLTTAVSQYIQSTLCNDVTGNHLGMDLVDKGEIGLKSGKGIYDYTGIDPQSYMNERTHKIIEMFKTVQV